MCYRESLLQGWINPAPKMGGGFCLVRHLSLVLLYGVNLKKGNWLSLPFFVLIPYKVMKAIYIVKDVLDLIGRIGVVLTLAVLCLIAFLIGLIRE